MKADNVEKLQASLASKKESIKDLKAEIKTLRPLKETVQAMEMDAFELRFGKEELEKKVKQLREDVRKASKAVELEQQALLKAQADHEQRLTECCMHALKRCVGLFAI